MATDGYEPPKGFVQSYKLTSPVRAWGDDVSEVGIRRPKGKDLRLADGLGEVEASLVLIEHCCGLTRGAVDDLDGFDVQSLGEIIGGFLESGPKTGSSD